MCNIYARWLYSLAFHRGNFSWEREFYTDIQRILCGAFCTLFLISLSLPLSPFLVNSSLRYTRVYVLLTLNRSVELEIFLPSCCCCVFFLKSERESEKKTFFVFLYFSSVLLISFCCWSIVTISRSLIHQQRLRGLILFLRLS